MGRELSQEELLARLWLIVRREQVPVLPRTWSMWCKADDDRYGKAAVGMYDAETDRIYLRPDYLRNPPPIYPRTARERSEEGTVLVEVEVLASGRCGGIRVLASSGHVALDEAAVRAVRQWVFRPARRFNQPVPFVVEIPITFQLIDAAAGEWRI